MADIRHDEGTMREIRDAVVTGKEVITHTDPIAVPGWSGAGYVVFDPVKGDGAWRIGGGENGGNYQSQNSAEFLILGVLNFLVPPANASAAKGAIDVAGYASDTITLADSNAGCGLGVAAKAAVIIVLASLFRAGLTLLATGAVGIVAFAAIFLLATAVSVALLTAMRENHHC